MEVYLIFNLKTFLYISKNKLKFFESKKYIFLTDKIFIFNYLKDNNIKVINLAFFLMLIFSQSKYTLYLLIEYKLEKI